MMTTDLDFGRAGPGDRTGCTHRCSRQLPLLPCECVAGGVSRSDDVLVGLVALGFVIEVLYLGFSKRAAD